MDEPVPPEGRERALEQALRERTRELAEMRGERDALADRVRRGQAHQRVLSDELQHRVRNMLAVVRSVLRRTIETSPSAEAFAAHFEGRLEAIGRYQTRGIWHERRSVEVEDVLRDELLPVHCLDTPACVIAGPTVHLDEAAIEPFTLAIHELAINAFKFGALRHEGGRLEIGWSVATGADGATLHFHWAERGVPMVAAAPPPRGFGRQYIEDALPYQLGATTEFALRPGGIACTITLPLRRAEPADSASGAPTPRPALLEQSGQ